MRSGNVREFIVDEFKDARKPLTLDEVAERMHLSRTKLDKQLRDSEPLSNFRGLTETKAWKVMEFYGEGVIFSAELEWLIREGRKAKKRLKEFARPFARKARGSKKLR